MLPEPEFVSHLIARSNYISSVPITPEITTPVFQKMKGAAVKLLVSYLLGAGVIALARSLPTATYATQTGSWIPMLLMIVI